MGSAVLLAIIRARIYWIYVLALSAVLASNLAPASALLTLSTRASESIQSLFGHSRGVSLELETYITQLTINNSKEEVCLAVPRSDSSKDLSVIPSRGTAVIAEKLWKGLGYPSEISIGGVRLATRVYPDSSLPGILGRCVLVNPSDLSEEAEPLGQARVIIRGRDARALAEALTSSIKRILSHLELGSKILSSLSSASLSILVIRRVSRDLKIFIEQGGDQYRVSLYALIALEIGVALSAALSIPLSLTVEHAAMGFINILYGVYLTSPTVNSEYVVSTGMYFSIGAALAPIYLLLAVRSR
jgi:hypothetical protein